MNPDPYVEQDENDDPDEETKEISWYEGTIEEPVRELVRLLRNNGFNTECSCGHEMYVQCQYIPDGQIHRLHDLLFNNGYRNYKIEVVVRVVGGNLHASLDISIEEKAGE